MTNEKIINCEIEYSKCFSKSAQTPKLIRFSDDLLIDMYAHNFTLIKNGDSNDELHNIINGEISLRKGSNFCNIVLYAPVSDCLLEKFDIKPQVSVNGFYLFDNYTSFELVDADRCTISKVSDKKMLDEILKLELEEDGEFLGVDFCTRRTYRRGEVYLADGGVNSYICYDGGEVIGRCDLFIHDGVAKIEDFAVSPSKQRQGYGSAMLKVIIDVALSEGASTIYLVADEEDTAKEMYLKNGFKKIGENSLDLVFNL